MQLTWLGHSCFKLVSAGSAVIFDPYAPDSVPGYPPLQQQADIVLTSHQHDDHNYTKAVTIINPDTKAFRIDYFDTYHDDVQGAKRGSNRVYIVAAENMRLAHLGDLGCDLTDRQIETLKNIDVLLIPVGGFFTIDGNKAAEIVSLLSPRLTIPMHYKGPGFGYDAISDASQFLSHFPQAVTLSTNTIEITADQPAGVTVLARPEF